MGLRFQKTIKVGKGVNVNLSKRGVSWSLGIPGTGVRWSSGHGKAAMSAGAIVALAVFAGLYFAWQWREDQKAKVKTEAVAAAKALAAEKKAELAAAKKEAERERKAELAAAKKEAAEQKRAAEVAIKKLEAYEKQAAKTGGRKSSASAKSSSTGEETTPDGDSGPD
jgi:uncharacterized protein HemX